MEYLGKRLRYGGYNASCVPPVAYGNRFMEFFNRVITTNHVAEDRPSQGRPRANIS
jgi:hypothetical protein